MAIGPRLDLRQSQSLVMTPQLQQAIKLLQLTNLELGEYVEQELEQNPLLERADAGADGAAELTSDAPEPMVEIEGIENFDAADTLLHASETGENIDQGQSIDVEVDNEFSTDTPGDASTPNSTEGITDNYSVGSTASASTSASTSSSGSGSGSGGDDMPGLDQTLVSEETLRDRLMAELPMMVATPGDRLIGEHLIDMLDDAGYVQGSLDELAERLGCEIEDVEPVLGRLQTVDPPGLFARDLKECLSLQLQDKGRLDSIMQAFLDNMDLLVKRDLKGLMKACQCDEEDIQDMVAEIRALDPKPGANFTHDVAPPVIPDVLMRPGPDGGWLIELNAETLPRVLVNNTYYAEVNALPMKAEDKHYIQDCLQTANWLVKSLHQRATTILKVSSEIVRQQDAFFREGVSALRPLVLRDIADKVEMHESTVSRVTSNKYIATPRGLFELKYFFTSSVGGSNASDGHSSAAVRQRIKELVDAEDPKKILSDDKLVALLKADGIEVARRTVAKYRDSLSIASSVQRRREKTSRL